jgi:hypothetical protein
MSDMPKCASQQRSSRLREINQTYASRGFGFSFTQAIDQSHPISTLRGRKVQPRSGSIPYVFKKAVAFPELISIDY